LVGGSLWARDGGGCAHWYGQRRVGGRAGRARGRRTGPRPGRSDVGRVRHAPRGDRGRGRRRGATTQRDRGAFAGSRPTTAGKLTCILQRTTSRAPSAPTSPATPD